LIRFLRYHPGGCSDTLVRPPVVSAGQTVSRRCGFQSQNLKAIRAHWNSLCFNRNGRIKTAQDLRQFLKGLIRNRLADDGTIRPNADQYLSASTIHEGAKSLSGSGKLSRALLEFKLIGFPSLNESQQLPARHIDDSTRQNPAPSLEPPKLCPAPPWHSLPHMQSADAACRLSCPGGHSMYACSGRNAKNKLGRSHTIIRWPAWVNLAANSADCAGFADSDYP
jgi:hypothetical protein